MKAGIYARVSSKRQRDAQTIEAQLRDLPVWCAAMGWPVIATFADDGISAKAGGIAKRLGLLAMLEAAQAGAFDVLVCVDIDRLTRSEDTIERALIVGTLQRARVKIASPSSGLLDPDTFAGDLTIGVKAAASAEWLRQHRARIKAGKASAIARNRKPAGPTPYGWRYSRATGAWAVDEAQAGVVREILRRVAGGETCHEVARDLSRRGVPRPRGGLWQSEQVWRVASDKAWPGAWTCDKGRGLTLALPPIAPVEACEAAAVALARHRRHTGPRARHVYLLERIATCGLCGARVGIASAEPSSGIRATYVCGRRRRVAPGAEPCPLHRHPIAETDAALWAALVDAIASERMAAVLLGRESARGRTSDAELEAARAKLGQLARARTVALSHHAAGLIDDLALHRHLADLADRERAARVAVSAAEASRGTGYPEDPRSVAEALAALRAACEAADEHRRREIVRRLAGKVTVGHHGVDVTLRLPAEWIRSSDRLQAGSNLERLAGRVAVYLPGGRDVPVHRKRRVG